VNRHRPARDRLKWIGLLLLSAAIFLTAFKANGQNDISAIRIYPPMGATPSPTPIPLTSPLFVASPPGDYNRLFIVCQTGQVYIVNLGTGVLNTIPFLDISSRLTSTFGEQGLLGLAFDPNYSTPGHPGNGKFYLNFTIPGGTNGITHVSQFQVSTNSPDVADLSNEKLLISFDHPETNHNGGWIGFSPRAGDENNLYIATGDGGAGNDQGTGHIEPGGNAQNTTTLLGKMLRIHVDSLNGSASIPPDNPFASADPPVQRSIWGLGLRNPFRNSFDRATGHMFIADVGQDNVEEIDVQQPSHPGGGENYGWRLREGNIATPTGSPVVGGPAPPGASEPVLAYTHAASGRTVIGGYVYRGKQIPSLRGVYIFGDYLGANGASNGTIFSLKYDGNVASGFQDITVQLFPIPNPPAANITLRNPASFGEDANGEIYFCDITAGSVFKVIPKTPYVALTNITRGMANAVVSGIGVPFKVHTIEATSDLTQQFQFLGTTTARGDGTFDFVDPNGGSVSTRFYRATYP
jgi:glucose/arabinose dehydrogenase